MPRRISCFLSVPVFTMVLLACLAAASPVEATWYMVHGHQGRIQDSSKIFSVLNHFAYGNQMVFNQSSSTWIHYAVPSIGSKSKVVKKVRVDVRLESNATLYNIHVYNGETLIKEFNGLDWTDGRYTQTLDLGSEVRFKWGLGISILAGAGSSAVPNDRRIFIYSVGGNFVAR